MRLALVLAVAWLPGALLAAGLPVAALAPAALGTTATSLRDGTEALTNIDAVKPIVQEWALAAALLAGGLATLLAGIAWHSPRRTLTFVGLVLALVPLGTAIAMQQTTDASWLGALLLVALLLRFAQGRFVPIAAATAVVGAIALFGAQVAAPRAGWQPFGEHSHPDQFHELSTKQTYGPLEGERTGKVMLEVTAPRPSLWRMQVLEGFDNRRWLVMGKDSHLPEPAAREESIKVEVRGLRNTLVVSPGEVTQVQAGPTKVSSLGDGYLLAAEPSEGDTYRVEADAVHTSAGRLASIPVPTGKQYRPLTQIGLGPIPPHVPMPLRRLANDVPTPLVGDRLGTPLPPLRAPLARRRDRARRGPPGRALPDATAASTTRPKSARRAKNRCSSFSSTPTPATASSSPAPPRSSCASPASPPGSRSASRPANRSAPTPGPSATRTPTPGSKPISRPSAGSRSTRPRRRPKPKSPPGSTSSRRSPGRRPGRAGSGRAGRRRCRADPAARRRPPDRAAAARAPGSPTSSCDSRRSPRAPGPPCGAFTRR